jgi:tetratricopeptide (TPR) repeat protein
VVFALSCAFLIAEAQPNSKAQSLFKRGNDCYAKGDFEGAIANFTKAIELSSRLDDHPQNADPGLASNFNHIRVLDPLTAHAYANRGLLFLRMGKPDQAERDFDRAIQLDPKLKNDLDQRIEAIKKLQPETSKQTFPNDTAHGCFDFDGLVGAVGH